MKALRLKRVSPGWEEAQVEAHSQGLEGNRRTLEVEEPVNQLAPPPPHRELSGWLFGPVVIHQLEYHIPARSA